MEALYLLVPLSVALAVIIAVVLVCSVRAGQFDDLEGPAYRVLADNDKPDETTSSSPAGTNDRTPES